MNGGKIGSESRQDFRFVESPKLLASFATPLIVPTVLRRDASALVAFVFGEVFDVNMSAEQFGM